MAIFEKALNPFGKAFGDMSPSGKNNAYANSIMFNAVGNKLRQGRKIASANNLSYGGVDDQGEHIFAPAGVYQPMQEAAEGIAGLLDSRPLPPADMGLMQQEGPKIFPPTHGDPLPPEMLPIPPIDPNLIGRPLPESPKMLPPPIYDFDYPEPAPIDPINNMYQEPITDDPYQYAQPDTRPPSVQVRDPMTEIPGPGRDPIFFEEVIPDPPIQPDPPMVVQGEVPGAGYIEDPVPFGAPIATATPIGQPIDTGNNPFYAGATNVAQPPSMTPVAPSFGLDVGVGSYGTPANTAGFSHPNIGGFGGFNLPSTLTPPEPTPPTNRLDYFDNRAATTAAPQTGTTPLPTVNSFAGFSGFGGF